MFVCTASISPPLNISKQDVVSDSPKFYTLNPYAIDVSVRLRLHIQLIDKRLSMVQLYRLRRLSKQTCGHLCREAVRYDDGLWMDLCCSRFNMPRHSRLEQGMTWRQLYRQAISPTDDSTRDDHDHQLVQLGQGKQPLRLWSGQQR